MPEPKKRKRTAGSAQQAPTIDAKVTPQDINTFPDGILYHILSFLNSAEVGKVRQSNKKWYEITKKYQNRTDTRKSQIKDLVEELGILVTDEAMFTGIHSTENYGLLLEVLKVYKKLKSFREIVKVDPSVVLFRENFLHFETLIKTALPKLKSNYIAKYIELSETYFEPFFLRNLAFFNKGLPEWEQQIGSIKRPPLKEMPASQPGGNTAKIHEIEHLVQEGAQYAIFQWIYQLITQSLPGITNEKQTLLADYGTIKAKLKLLKLNLPEISIGELTNYQINFINFIKLIFSNEHAFLFGKYILLGLEVLSDAYENDCFGAPEKFEKIMQVLSASSEIRNLLLTNCSKQAMEFLCTDPVKFEQVMFESFIAQGNLIVYSLSELGKIISDPGGDQVLAAIVNNKLYKRAEKLNFFKHTLVQPRYRSGSVPEPVYFVYRHPRLLREIIRAFLADELQKTKEKSKRAKSAQFYTYELATLSATLDVCWTHEEICSYIKNNSQYKDWIIGIPEIVTYWSAAATADFYKAKAKIKNNIYELLKQCPHRFLIFKKFKNFTELSALYEQKTGEKSVLELLCRPHSSSVCHWIFSTKFGLKAIAEYVQETPALYLLYQQKNVDELIKIDSRFHPMNFNQETVNLFNQVDLTVESVSLKDRLSLLFIENESLGKYALSKNLTWEHIASFDEEKKVKTYQLLLALNDSIKRPEKYTPVSKFEVEVLRDLLLTVGTDGFKQLMMQDGDIIEYLVSEPFLIIAEFISSGIFATLAKFKTLVLESEVPTFPRNVAFFQQPQVQMPRPVMGKTRNWLTQVLDIIPASLLLELHYETFGKESYLSIISQCGDKYFSSVMKAWKLRDISSRSQDEYRTDKKLFILEWYSKPWTRLFNFNSSSSIEHHDLLEILPLSLIDTLGAANPEGQINPLEFLTSHIDIHTRIMAITRADFANPAAAPIYMGLVTFLLQVATEGKYLHLLQIVQQYGVDNLLNCNEKQKNILQQFLAKFPHNVSGQINFITATERLFEQHSTLAEFIQAIIIPKQLQELEEKRAIDEVEAPAVQESVKKPRYEKSFKEGEMIETEGKEKGVEEASLSIKGR